MSVGPDDTALWDVGDQRYLTGTSMDGSERVWFRDDRDRVLEVLSRVQQDGKVRPVPVPRSQVWPESAMAGAPDRAQQTRRRGRSRRSGRMAAATPRRGNERGRGD